MSFTGFKFNGLHSYEDMGLTIENRKIGNPSKIKRTEKVPHSNHLYDFSNIYVGQEFEERPIEYEVNIAWRDKAKDFYTYETEILNWLMGKPGKQMLVDDLVPGYYFLAEVVDSIDTDFLFHGGKSKISFTAYPFKIGELEEGNDLWDPFNFLLDVAQITEFNTNGTKEITLYNIGTSIVKPIIKTNAPFEIIKNGTTFNIPAGESDSYDFLLFEGGNKMTIKGNGKISFHFRKELI